MNTNVFKPFENLSFRIENNILFCKLNQANCYLTEQGVLRYLSLIQEITKGQPMSLILDIRSFVGSFSPTAAQLFADSPISKSCIINQAFITDTLNGKLLVGSYIRIYGQEADIKIFDQMESAMAYCMQSQAKIEVGNV